MNALMPAWFGCCAVVGMAWVAAAASRGWGRPMIRLLALLQLGLFAIDFGNAERPVSPALRELDR